MGLEEAIASIRKEFGEGLIRTLEDIPRLQGDAIDTGSYAINRAIGCGGWPKRHMVEIFGPDACGKTTLCHTAIASVQKSGGVAAMVDVEHKVVPEYAQAIGVDLNKLWLSQPNSGEDACKVVKVFLQEKALDLVVIDSIAALTPQVFIDGEFTDANIGKHARLMSDALRQFSQLKTLSNCCILMTNQIREKPGMVYGNPLYQPGGGAPKFYSSLRGEMKKKAEKNDDGNEITQ